MFTYQQGVVGGEMTTHRELPIGVGRHGEELAGRGRADALADPLGPHHQQALAQARPQVSERAAKRQPPRGTASLDTSGRPGCQP